MIKINDFKAYCEKLKEEIRADYSVYVIREDHLQKKIKGRSGTFLAVVLPSVNFSGVRDNYKQSNTTIIYILQDFSKTSITDQMEIQMYSSIQNDTTKIVDRMLLDAHNSESIMSKLEIPSINIEPEYNVAGAYNGYSITFSFFDI